MPLGWLRLKMLLANGNSRVIFISLFNRKKTFSTLSHTHKSFFSEGMKYSSLVSCSMFPTGNGFQITRSALSGTCRNKTHSQLWPLGLEIKWFLPLGNTTLDLSNLLFQGLETLMWDCPHPRYNQRTRSSTSSPL